MTGGKPLFREPPICLDRGKVNLLQQIWKSSWRRGSCWSLPPRKYWISVSAQNMRHVSYQGDFSLRLDALPGTKMLLGSGGWSKTSLFSHLRGWIPFFRVHLISRSARMSFPWKIGNPKPTILWVWGILSLRYYGYVDQHMILVGGLVGIFGIFPLILGC